MLLAVALVAMVVYGFYCYYVSSSARVLDRLGNFRGGQWTLQS